jgi:isocitrate dehydrogenase
MLLRSLQGVSSVLTQRGTLRAFPVVSCDSQATRSFSSGNGKLIAPPMVYISGEEMTRYTMELILEKWINRFVNTDSWEFYDLSCHSRDETEDQVLHDAVEAGARIGAIFKEPTITPTEEQKVKLGLKKAWGSPNGAMRRGWNGITISRDTIHIEGIDLGFKKPVFFERHAVGGEYGAGWAECGEGKLETIFYPDDPKHEPYTIDTRVLSNNKNVAVVYHNPLDNVPDLAHHFFSRCLQSNIVPYVVTKKTVFKWQDGFWQIMRDVFNTHYRSSFKEKGLLDGCHGELQHLISDAATMQIIRWTDGGFGMAAHNYDGDMLTDEVAQVHRSPGFITSNLIGKRSDGTMIKEYEASHGTVADLWQMHLEGKETSMNPLGMAEAIIGAMEHSSLVVDAAKGADYSSSQEIKFYTKMLRKALHNTFRKGEGTRDMNGPQGLTTEQFIDKVAERLERYLNSVEKEVPDAIQQEEATISDEPITPIITDLDKEAVAKLFAEYDDNGDGVISKEEFEVMLVKLGVAPMMNMKTQSKDHETVA